MPNPRVSNSTRYKRVVSKVRDRRDPCAVCWHPIDYELKSPDPMSFELDHIKPMSKGGDPYDPANGQATHRCCNNWRKDRPMSYVEAVMNGTIEPRTPPPIWREGSKPGENAQNVAPTFDW